MTCDGVGTDCCVGIGIMMTFGEGSLNMFLPMESVLCEGVVFPLDAAPDFCWDDGEWISEGEGETIGSVWRGVGAEPPHHVFLALELDPAFGIEPVHRADELLAEFRIVGEDPTGPDPSPHRSPHGCALVGVDLAGVACSGAADVVDPTELHVPAVVGEGAHVVNHAATNAATIDEDAVGVVMVARFHYLAGELHCGEAPVELPWDTPSVAPTPQGNNGLVGAVACHVATQRDRALGVFDLPEHSLVHIVGGDKFHLAYARKHATHANTNEVGVFAIGFDPLLEDLLVGEGDGSGVDLAGAPE